MTASAAVLIALLVIVVSAFALYAAVGLWHLAVLTYEELVLIFSKDAPKRLTRAEKKMQEAEWAAFLEDLKIDHFKQTINVFRDGYARV